MHPGWECEESTKRRMEKMRIAGVDEKAPENVRIPEITAETKPDAEQGTAGQEDDFDIVTDDGFEQQSAQAAQESVGNTTVSI